MDCYSFVRLSLLTTFIALLPTTGSAQDSARIYGASEAKQFAILGAPSRLLAMKAAQVEGRMPEPVPEPVAKVAPAFNVSGFASVSHRPEGFASQPDIFGSTALKIGRTPLDDKWRRIRAAGSANALWARLAPVFERRGRLEQIAAINSWVNTRLSFREDRQTWGTEDRWSTLSESLARGRGDCEDFAIAKMQLLSAAGIPADDLYLTIVKDLVRRADHAILVIRVDDKFLVLDNGTDRILESQDVRDYRPIFTYSANSEWIHGYRKPIERKPIEFTSLASVPTPGIGR